MAKNQRYTESRHIALPLPYDRQPGEAVRVGGFCGVALNGGKSGETNTVWLDGSYDVTVTGVTAPGTVIYITGAGALNVTAAGNTAWGLALGTKTAAAGVVEVAPLGRTIPVTGA